MNFVEEFMITFTEGIRKKAFTFTFINGKFMVFTGDKSLIKLSSLVEDTLSCIWNWSKDARYFVWVEPAVIKN